MSKLIATTSAAPVEIAKAPSADESLNSQGTAGVVKRALLVPSVVVPALVGAGCYFANQHGWLAQRNLVWTALGATSLLSMALVWRCAAKLGRVDDDRNHVENLLRTSRNESDVANRIKGAFLASMSHEIRTPLTAIVGFSDLLLGRRRSPEEHEEFIRTIKRNGEHLLTITNDILDLSKIEAGKMRVENMVTSPTEIVAEVCSMLRAPAIEKGLDLEVTYDGPIPKNIRTDPTRLRQALINLIGNAIKFTESGGIAIVVGLATSPQDKNPMLRLSVTDTGIGLTKEQMENLFVPFLQADVETSRKFGGTGLGLSITKHLAGLLGGDVTVTSKPGKGSTFSMTIQTGSLEGVPILVKPTEAGVQGAAALPEKFELKGRILLAEDGVSNQKVISTYLREAGCYVDIAPNGQQAIEKAMVNWRGGLPYDLVLMDMLMPVLDGYQATAQLRQQGYTRPIVALTANALAGDRSKCLNVGCNDFMTKPIEPLAFMKMVERQLKLAQGSAVTRPNAA
jgi:signal transduction histidine kinase/CheY-like chemotaxis protein